MLKRLNPLRGRTSTSSPRPHADAPTPQTPAPASTARRTGLSFQGLRRMLPCIGGSSLPHDSSDPIEQDPDASTPAGAFGRVPADALRHITSRLPVESLIAFGAASRSTRDLSNEALAERRARFLESAPTVDPTSAQALTTIDDWLKRHGGEPIRITEPAEFAAVMRAQEAAVAYVMDRPLDATDQVVASDLWHRLFDLMERAPVTPNSARPMGDLLASNLAFAAQLRFSPGGPDKAECDRMVTRMTTTALRHGRDAAVGLLRYACDRNYARYKSATQSAEPRLTPLRFLGEALFQLRPASSTATSLAEYIANDLKGSGPRFLPAAPTAQAPLVETLLLTASKGSLRYNDATHDWTEPAVRAHGMQLASLSELSKVHHDNRGAACHVLDLL